MKKRSHLFTAAVALLAAAAFSGNASGQDASPSPKSTPEESLSSMAPTTVKPSKAELAKKNGQSGSAQASGSAASTTNAASGSVDRRDRDFMMMAAKGGTMEVHMGQMAEKMGQSADVKKLGARMVADHTKVNNELMALAQAKGVKLDTRHKMDQLSGADFDQKWLAMMVTDHDKDIAAFQTEASGGMDPQLKSFAVKNLPTLKKHLEMVKAAQGKMTKKS